MTKADLKTGMVVTCRSGEAYEVNLESGQFKNDRGFNYIDGYNDDLTSAGKDNKWDIVKVSGILWQRCEHEYVCAKCGEKLEKPPTLQS